MRLLIACCIASPLILLAPLASPHMRSALTTPVARWASQQAALPAPDADATPIDESSIVVSPGRPYCGLDGSGTQFCVLVLNQTMRLFPNMFQAPYTPTPFATATPWPGAASAPTANQGYVPCAGGDYGGGCSSSYGGP